MNKPLKEFYLKGSDGEEFCAELLNDRKDKIPYISIMCEEGEYDSYPAVIDLSFEQVRELIEFLHPIVYE